MAGHEMKMEVEEAPVAAVAAVFAAWDPPGEPPRLERQIAVLGRPDQNEEKGPTSMDWSD